MSYQEQTNQLISGYDILYYRLKKKNHCACVWILTDVDFTDDGDGRVGAEGLYWLLPFLLDDVNKSVSLKARS